MSSVQELLRRCGPAIAALDAPPDVVERALSDHRALWIYIDSCMGTRDIEVSTVPIAGIPPDILLARKVPSDLERVGDPFWDYRDDALKGLRIPLRKRRPVDPLAAWRTLPPELQARQLAELQAIAAKQAAADHSNPGLIHRAPQVEPSSSEAAEGKLTLHFVFDHMIWHAAQSGSDWYDHRVYTGQAEFAADVLLQSSIERRETYQLSEFDEPTYEPYVPRRHLLDELQAAARPRRARR